MFMGEVIGTAVLILLGDGVVEDHQTGPAGLPVSAVLVEELRFPAPGRSGRKEKSSPTRY